MAGAFNVELSTATAAYTKYLASWEAICLVFGTYDAPNVSKSMEITSNTEQDVPWVAICSVFAILGASNVAFKHEIVESTGYDLNVGGRRGSQHLNGPKCHD